MKSVARRLNSIVYMIRIIITYTAECPEGEVFAECEHCAGFISCANPNPHICPDVCAFQCVCAEGTFRNEQTGKCVPLEQCP